MNKKVKKKPTAESASRKAVKEKKMASKKRRKYFNWSKHPDAEKKLKEMFPTATWPELLKAFPGHTHGGLNSHAQVMRYKRSEFAEKAKKDAQENFSDKFAKFLSRARTDTEIEQRFEKDGLVKLREFETNPPENHLLKHGLNHYKERTSYLVSIPKKYGPVVIANRVFTRLHSKDDMDYLSIIFPPELHFTPDGVKDAIQILPADSVWWGDHSCDKTAFMMWVNWLESKDYAFGFLNGDIIGGNNYLEDPSMTRAELKRVLAPIAHKILWAQSGPLERRMTRIDKIEPLQDICFELGIHHTDRPVRADLYWGLPEQPVEFYAIHGRSMARLDGTKANAAFNISQAQNFPNFTILGHLKEGISDNAMVRRLDPKKFKILERTAYVLVCPGFRKFEGSEEEKKGLPPPHTGFVICQFDKKNRCGLVG